MNLDDIYSNANLSISLIGIKDHGDETPNYDFIIYQNKNIILKDQVYSKVGEIQFEDFNNDGVKDILIQNISDVRSNWTYYLYLYEPKNKIFNKVKNFEMIKNPTYNPKQDCIESYVVSGTNYLNFYKIIGDTIKDLNHMINDNQSTNFEKSYKKAIKKPRK